MIQYEQFLQDRMVAVEPQPTDVNDLRRLGFGNIPKQPSFWGKLFGGAVALAGWGLVRYDRATGVVDPGGFFLSVGKRRVSLLPGKLPAEEDWATALSGQGEYRVIQGSELESQATLPPVRQETCDYCNGSYNNRPRLKDFFKWERSKVLKEPDKYIRWERDACHCPVCGNCGNYTYPGNCAYCGYIN